MALSGHLYRTLLFLVSCFFSDQNRMGDAERGLHHVYDQIRGTVCLLSQSVGGTVPLLLYS